MKQFTYERATDADAAVAAVGYGVAAAIRAHPQGLAKARVRMGSDGIALVQTDMTDIGTGTYTILTQVAAEALDLPIERVRVDL